MEERKRRRRGSFGRFAPTMSANLGFRGFPE
jgi:hypothetical protein